MHLCNVLSQVTLHTSAGPRLITATELRQALCFSFDENLIVSLLSLLFIACRELSCAVAVP